METKCINLFSTGKEFFKSIDNEWNMVGTKNKARIAETSHEYKRDQKISSQVSKAVGINFLII